MVCNCVVHVYTTVELNEHPGHIIGVPTGTRKYLHVSNETVLIPGTDPGPSSRSIPPRSFTGTFCTADEVEGILKRKHTLARLKHR